MCKYVGCRHYKCHILIFHKSNWCSMFDYDTCGGGGKDGKPSQVNNPCFNMEMKINSETDLKTNLNLALTCYASGDFNTFFPMWLTNPFTYYIRVCVIWNVSAIYHILKTFIMCLLFDKLIRICCMSTISVVLFTLQEQNSQIDALD